MTEREQRVWDAAFAAAFANRAWFADTPRKKRTLEHCRVEAAETADAAVEEFSKLHPAPPPPTGEGSHD